jgi:RNA polymerase sigma-70 factor (ECF subfamily)
LEAEYQEEGKSELFTALKQTLAGTRETPPYDQLAACLNLNEGTIKTAVHRLRHRYRDLIRAEIAKTLDRPQDIEDELRHLFNALTKK